MDDYVDSDPLNIIIFGMRDVKIFDFANLFVCMLRSFLSDVYISIRVKGDAFVSASDCDLSAWFCACLCLPGFTSVLLRLIRGMV